MKSITEDPLHVTHVLAEPLFTSRSPSPAAQWGRLLPRVSVLVFPHCEEWALKSPRTSSWRGRHLLTHSPTPSRKSSNAARPRLGET